jgi:tetratricopeptide (TPR) repeat protein
MRNTIALLLGLVLVTGCGKRPVPVPEPDPGSPPVVPSPVSPGPGSPAVPARQARHDAALLEAYTQLARGRYAEALAALEAARTIDPTEQVSREIDRVRLIQAQQAGAQKAVADLRTVLREGKPEEAARLASQALVLYGTTEVAEELTQLKRQADALVAAQAG